MSAPDAPALRQALLGFYDAERRDLPWRRDPSPWRVWVSEVMLQQTRVETVLGYYERFLERFPDAASLAAAEVDEVLALWSGLGYYRRARLLHRGARAVVAEHGGEIPTEPARLREVPGIGPYTAGALLSIAYGQPEPLVDGNVERVLTRLDGLRGDPRKAPLKRRLWERAAELVDPERPGDFNQALMELGATVCKPRGPACDRCPLSPWCQARAEGSQDQLPELAARRALRKVRMACLVLEGPAGLLMLRRPDSESLMPGLWELPTVELPPRKAAARALAALVRERTGLEVRVRRRLATVRHGILDRSIRLEVHPATPEPDEHGPGEGSSWRWVPRARMGELGASSMVAKALGAVPPTA